jgi:hypothetical protein
LVIVIVRGCDHRGDGWPGPGLPRGKRATKPTISAGPPAEFADYLFVETEPVVADAGGGIIFHVSARYFQFAPSCTTTLI